MNQLLILFAAKILPFFKIMKMNHLSGQKVFFLIQPAQKPGASPPL